ncbi:transglycosylase domain-containing protein [Clavibacter nebraskensis]|uniref:Penicillin-binding protein n=2 Tax=Clavibacter nebraskensis TaxID=31963 RepID=A0A399PUW2_9MICO|nr:transglycosylase domain-containing protein [Clavibacter nebraskensis]KXU21376.1 penicillin-binding protein [Clavibacter nebraskensis]OAH20183.1 penicillin-binding protein [Clavibacter nebraskensis]QGV66128.1 transglycosylase domain-containing protein [Clavibacter nebraskensis]QGV68926.1 transglycosylase domain-containing protein [Clavibacter nebraskensis]QGV71716.1 transglycosylase domain-containing protein [Clavibacter nebraskensis]
MRKTDLTISTRLGAFLGLVGMSTIAGVLVAAMVTPAIAVSGIAANSTIGVFEDIPDNLQIDNLAQKTVLYAKQGDSQVPFAEFFSQDREEVPWDAVSSYAKDAAIATEDPRYYEHGGVDVLSAARALAQNVLNKEVQSGASTITMQYVRNVLVQKAQNMVDSSDEATQAAGRKAFTEATQPDMPRKLKEMRMAIGVEKKYSKNEILLAYLNIANFGSRVYGIESAARYYFNVSAADLTLEQAASLIATVNAPEVFKIDNPDNLERNKERRDLLLRNMLKEQKITQEQYDTASAAAITPTITPSTSGCIQANPISAAYFCDYVKNEILTNPEFGATPAERDAVLKRGGMQVYTTLDLDIQANAAEQMRKQVPTTARFTKIGGSVVSREVKTGRVIAMAQNTDYGVGDQPGITEVNYSADFAHGGSRGFQVGSTYKIFTLVDWLKSGKSIYQTVNASKTNWQKSEFTSCGNRLSGPAYPVTNDTNTGATSNQTVLQATVASVNSAFIAMASQLDICDITNTAKDMGVYNADPDQPVSSQPSDVVGSGGNNVAPLQMATAFSSVANQGTMCPPIVIDKVVLPDESELVTPKSDCTQAMSPDVANTAAFTLKAVMGGTGAASNPRDGTEIMGKTGTTDRSKDTWFVGSSTEVTTAVWVGNVEGFASMRRNVLNGSAADSARHRIFKPLQTFIDDRYPAEGFPAPSSALTKKPYVPPAPKPTQSAAPTAPEAPAAPAAPAQPAPPAEG